ncbi:hypothetical protein CRP01_08465 [Flavilitoribacter nigricans DSM 23189 = NBRC 102662]|uniref:Uncharacterized protein n=1 Tax=Flavilitoribacter nigricans (strain ATCC 23147 / DSM 23189 / NBRC 102662 / NCIMB 1420 / SS-2) TaxID=1122177 RepID=A0A2D0NEP5_FLAN2|nr:hypothetical protein CRP01_08465 [Flavilitoribacter nigricans DSM 23189 = NBRC 102662]
MGMVAVKDSESGPVAHSGELKVLLLQKVIGGDWPEAKPCSRIVFLLTAGVFGRGKAGRCAPPPHHGYMVLL